MKALFVIWGCAWLVFLGGYLARKRWGDRGMLAFSVATLWYLVFGTLCCVILIALLLLSRRMRRKTEPALSP